jgi:hypothetical protein
MLCPLELPMFSPDAELASTPTNNAVLPVLSYPSRSQDQLLRRHNSKPSKRGGWHILSVPKDPRKMLLAASSRDNGGKQPWRYAV